MPDNELDGLTIEGFTSIENASIDFGRLNVLVGANGAGKSNLVRAMEMLGRIVDEDLRLFVSSSGGASTLVTLITRRVGSGCRFADTPARTRPAIGPS
jgi:predicted ATPase